MVGRLSGHLSCLHAQTAVSSVIGLQARVAMTTLRHDDAIKCLKSLGSQPDSDADIGLCNNSTILLSIKTNEENI